MPWRSVLVAVVCMLVGACARPAGGDHAAASAAAGESNAPEQSGATEAMAPVPAATYLTSAQDTDIPGVTAQVAYLRQYDGVLHAGVVLHNNNDKRVRADEPVAFKDFDLVDAKANRKLSPLKDADGRYLAGPADSTLQGGRWGKELAPRSDTLFWVLFDAIPAGDTVRLEGPLFHGFDNLAVTQQAPSPAAVASSARPLRAMVVSAERANGVMRVRIRIDSPGGRMTGDEVLNYADVYALDPIGKRSYPLLKGTDGVYVASPLDNRVNGGRWPLYKIAPNGQQIMDLSFPAPPDTVTSVDIVLPWFAPFEHVAISGAGGASPSAGLAVAGAATPLQRALADLKADVTPETVKVDLSADVLFDFDKSDLKAGAEPDLAKLATVLTAYPAATVKIDGYTDGKGTEAHNRPLSDRRASAVATWLQAHAGVAAARISTHGFGSANPVAPNTNPDGSDNPDGRAKNRRVEITISKGR
ncbi:MAG TPA: OmpA family protein [Caulobacteraceae bacterium]|nr:OmpA family protein [Caulobacteraceae bacterium]